jgi:hypothetical protein
LFSIITRGLLWYHWHVYLESSYMIQTHTVTADGLEMCEENLFRKNDLLVMSMGGERFTWGQANLQQDGEVRRQYIDALKTADNHDYGPLLGFARS